MNKLKKMISFIIVFTIIISMSSKSIVANASNENGHPKCIFRGSWYNNKQSDLIFYIRPSAITNQFPQSTYYCITQWNNISRKVKVSYAFPAEQVYLGNKNVIYNDTTLLSNVYGKTLFYDITGQEIDPNLFSSIFNNAQPTVNTVEIGLNISSISNKEVPSTFMKYTVLHEVGHALLLRHPSSDSSYSGHEYYGFREGEYVYDLPKSVMNQLRGGFDQDYFSSNVVVHDRNQIKYKWGYK